VKIIEYLSRNWPLRTAARLNLAKRNDKYIAVFALLIVLRDFYSFDKHADFLLVDNMHKICIIESWSSIPPKHAVMFANMA
jgi:hypothetical protein